MCRVGGPGRPQDQGCGAIAWADSSTHLLTDCPIALTPEEREGGLKTDPLPGGSQPWLHIRVTWGSRGLPCVLAHPPHPAALPVENSWGLELEAGPRAGSPASVLLTLGTDYSLGWGHAVCPVACPAASPASDASSALSPNCDSQIHLQTWPSCPWGGGRIAPVEPLGLGDKWTSMGTTMQTLSCLPGLPKTMGFGELSFCHMLPQSS